MAMLLGPEEIQAARARAITRAKHGELVEYDDELCRAQVKHLVDEHETRMENAKMYWTYDDEWQFWSDARVSIGMEPYKAPRATGGAK